LPDEIYRKTPRNCDPNFLSEVAKLSKFYCKGIVEYDCNRMIQNAAYNCVQSSNYSRGLIYSKDVFLLSYIFTYSMQQSPS